MTQIVVDIDPDIAERLELRAQRLGSTVQREVSRLIRERLEAEPARPSGAATDNAAEGAHAGAAQADAALERLRRAGLACGRASGPRLHILGGTSVSNGAGLGAYQRPFAILEEQAGGFLAMVAGARPFHDEEARVDALDEAVEAILRIYGARGALPAGEPRR